MSSAFSTLLVYSLAVNSVVGLALGLALLWVGRRPWAQPFTRDMAHAQLLQSLVPLGFGASLWAEPRWAVAGLALALAGQMGSLALVLRGCNGLSGGRVTRLEWAGLLGLLAVAWGWAVVFNEPSLVAWAPPVFLVAAGVVASRSLHSSPHADRLVGPLLLLLGANQAVFAVSGGLSQPLQWTADTLLRLVLGLLLVCAALGRYSAESQRWQEQFQRLVERLHQGIFVLVERRVLYANPALLSIYGVARAEELSVTTMLRGIRREEIDQVFAHFRQLDGGGADEVHWEGLRHRPNGSSVWLRFSAWRTVWGNEQAIQVLVTDQTAGYEASRALLYQATHDELTGLPNRNALLQRLRQRCVAMPERSAFGLVLLGVDRFRLFNEAHGHGLGDEVLKALAAAVVGELGEGCELMRLGSDEFAFLALPSQDGDSAESMARRVQKLLQQPLVLPQHRFFIDVSMGIGLYPEHAQDAEALLRSANAAMHEAKRTPGTSVTLAEARFERGSSDVLEQEQSLRTGIELREFSLYYQPKVDAHTGHLTSFEALARWHRPGVGWVSPAEFIAVAERTGLIEELGLLLLTQACGQVADWRGRFAQVVPVAVNVSPLQMLDGGFPALVEQLLRQFGLPSHAITLEITESAAVANLEQARGQIQQLRNLGIAVGLDDFGTGFSSLNMLRSLPLQSVKIDRGLIEPLPAPDAVAVVRAICQLAAALQLEVVAEGIETPEQADMARLAGCQELQGDLFAKPLTPAEAALWLADASVAILG